MTSPAATGRVDDRYDARPGARVVRRPRQPGPAGTARPTQDQAQRSGYRSIPTIFSVRSATVPAYDLEAFPERGGGWTPVVRRAAGGTGLLTPYCRPRRRSPALGGEGTMNAPSC